MLLLNCFIDSHKNSQSFLHPRWDFGVHYITKCPLAIWIENNKVPSAVSKSAKEPLSASTPVSIPNLNAYANCQGFFFLNIRSRLDFFLLWHTDAVCSHSNLWKATCRHTHAYTTKKCLIVALNKWCTDACGINKLDRFRVMSKRSGAAVCK